jgi:hypothetical protein
VLTRGVINFDDFTKFLLGRPSLSSLANGITERNLRTTDYNFFLQDDWKVSSHLTLNLGLRYELDLPPYDTHGRLSTFDPSLYKTRPLSDTATTKLVVPLGGIVQADNAPTTLHAVHRTATIRHRQDKDRGCRHGSRGTDLRKRNEHLRLIDWSPVASAHERLLRV